MSFFDSDFYQKNLQSIRYEYLIYSQRLFIKINKKTEIIDIFIKSKGKTKNFVNV